MNTNASDGSSSANMRQAPTSQFPQATGSPRGRFRNMHDMAVVLVGPKEVKFTLHTDLLASNSPFFAAALQGHFAEAATNIVRLPEEKADVFEWFVQWLYTGSLQVAAPTNCCPPAPSDAELAGGRRAADALARRRAHETHCDGDLRNSQGSPKYFLLIDLYALSDRMMTTSLSNHVIDTVARLSESTNSVPTPSDTWLLYGDCCSFSGVNHTACSTLRSTSKPTTMKEVQEATLAALRPRPSQTCPCGSNNLGVRPSSPLHALILDLFAYKKTDRLLASHRDDWHPLFLRDLVVKLKRPGQDMIRRHKLRDWRPTRWSEAKACDGCRSVVGPSSNIALAANDVAALTAHVNQQQNDPRLAQLRPGPTGANNNNEGNSLSGANGPNAHPTLGGAGGGRRIRLDLRIRFHLPQKCDNPGCGRVYCSHCMISAFNGGLENGDSRFALTGGDVGPCKPWSNWEDLFEGEEDHEEGGYGEEEEEGLFGELLRRDGGDDYPLDGDDDDDDGMEGAVSPSSLPTTARGPLGQSGMGIGGGRVRRARHGVCGRYHEHGMLGGRA